MTLLQISLLLLSVNGQPSVFGDLSGDGTISAGLLEDLAPVAAQAAAVEGADIAVGLVDMETGERLVVGEEGPLDMGNPELPVVACAVDLTLQGAASLEDTPGRDESAADLIRETARGRADPGINLQHYIGDEAFFAWLEETGLAGTEYHGFQLHFDRAPAVDQNYTTIADMLTMLEVLNRGLDQPEIRRLLRHDFPAGPAILAEAEGVVPYGISTFEEEGESIGAIGVLPDGSRVGVAVIASQPCCAGKGELAFRMVWSELQQGVR